MFLDNAWTNQTVNDPLVSEKNTKLNSKNKLDWDHLRYFVAVVKAGTVIGAARHLGVSHATVLRNVSRLEAFLGIRLFDRVQSGALRPIIDRTFPLDEIVASHRHMESNEQMGKIIVTT